MLFQSHPKRCFVVKNVEVTVALTSLSVQLSFVHRKSVGFVLILYDDTFLKEVSAVEVTYKRL